MALNGHNSYTISGNQNVIRDTGTTVGLYSSYFSSKPVSSHIYPKIDLMILGTPLLRVKIKTAYAMLCDRRLASFERTLFLIKTHVE